MKLCFDEHKITCMHACTCMYEVCNKEWKVYGKYEKHIHVGDNNTHKIFELKPFKPLNGSTNNFTSTTKLFFAIE